MFSVRLLLAPVLTSVSEFSVVAEKVLLLVGSKAPSEVTITSSPAIGAVPPIQLTDAAPGVSYDVVVALTSSQVTVAALAAEVSSTSGR